MILFGAPPQHRVVTRTVQWPKFDDMGKASILDQSEQESILRDNKIKIIEWTTIDTVVTMRFTF